MGLNQVVRSPGMIMVQWCGSADKEGNERRGSTAGRFTILYVAISEIECSRCFLILMSKLFYLFLSIRVFLVERLQDIQALKNKYQSRNSLHVDFSLLNPYSRSYTRSFNSLTRFKLYMMCNISMSSSHPRVSQPPTGYSMYSENLIHWNLLCFALSDLDVTGRGRTGFRLPADRWGKVISRLDKSRILFLLLHGRIPSKAHLVTFMQLYFIGVKLGGCLTRV